MAQVRMLSDDVVAKIAAGEVVERPASVVKELVENSLDAGAGRVTVEVEESGQREIRVSDDGCGMSREDCTRAVKRYSTSKIRSAGDLEHIATLGFRGEALAAVAAAATMEIVTQRSGDDCGTRLIVQDGRVAGIEDAGAPAGTTVTVRDLFVRTPARRKFLKSAGTELGHVTRVVMRLAVAHPAVGFTLRSSRKEVLGAPPGQRLDERIRSLYGGLLADGLVEVDDSSRGVCVTGRAAKAELARSQPDRLLFFVRGRPVTGRMLSHAVAAGYDALLPRGRYPAAFIFLEVEDGAMDVNVHPTKHEVRFADDRAVHDAIACAVRGALRKCPAGGREALEHADGVREALGRYISATGSGGRQGMLTGKEPQRLVEHRAWEGPPPVQVARSYLLVEADEGLVLVDQHAAHERVLYEGLCRGLASGRPECQLLLVPIEMELAAGEWELYRECAPELARVGFEMEEFGARTLLVRGIPAAASGRDARELIGGIVSDLAEVWKPGVKDITEPLARSLSCHAAVKAGERMSTEEMKALLSDLGRCELSQACPHGRPVTVCWTLEEIEKRFRRR